MQDTTSYVIGGADGPTSVFIAGEVGVSWLNLSGLIMIILILIPNIVYAIKHKEAANTCKNKGMIICEQIGRYASMFFMIFNIGIAEFGFRSVGAFLAYFLLNGILILGYLIIWGLYFHKQTFKRSMTLAMIPTLLFLISGLTLRHYLLIVSAILFGIGHIYVTYQNAKE